MDDYFIISATWSSLLKTAAYKCLTRSSGTTYWQPPPLHKRKCVDSWTSAPPNVTPLSSNKNQMLKYYGQNLKNVNSIMVWLNDNWACQANKSSIQHKSSRWLSNDRFSLTDWEKAKTYHTMRTGALLHHRRHPKTEQDVLRKPSRKPEKHREEAEGLSGKNLNLPTLEWNSCMQRARSEWRGKSINVYTTLPWSHKYTASVCILTLSTSAGSSTWSSFVMPVQNK